VKISLDAQKEQKHAIVMQMQLLKLNGKRSEKLRTFKSLQIVRNHRTRIKIVRTLTTKLQKSLLPHKSSLFIFINPKQTAKFLIAKYKNEVETASRNAIIFAVRPKTRYLHIVNIIKEAFDLWLHAHSNAHTRV